ncbi:MAG: diguanylate cyclase domain-containing protein, partial [Gemmatimonas sp.]
MKRRLNRKHARELEAIELALMRSPAALVVTDARHRIVAASPAYQRLVGPRAAAEACPGAIGCGCAGWRHLAEHDALTGLPNRAQLESELARALARAARHRQRLAVLFVDLDGFKQVNDGEGHACGDGLLRKIGVRMRET